MPDVQCGFPDVEGGASGTDLLVAYGPTIAVDIGFDSNYRPQQGGVPVAGISGILALVDTGATESCIDSLLAAQLNLPIVDRRVTSGAHGSREVNVHLAQIHVPAIPFTIWGQFAAVDLAAGGQPHKTLLGRTFLRSFVMLYVGTSGTVTIRRP